MTLGGFIPSGEQAQNAANTRLVSAMSPSAVIDFHPAPGDPGRNEETMKKESIEKAMKEMGVGELAASHNSGSQQPMIAVLTRAAKACGRGNGPGNAGRNLPGGRTVGEVLARAEEIDSKK